MSMLFYLHAPLSVAEYICALSIHIYFAESAYFLLKHKTANFV